MTQASAERATRESHGDPHDEIVVRGAREHNLRDLDVRIPREKLVVITGLSGSGKSSLAFDTIYAEGQRRYVESLSAYARQFLDQMEKPDVESVEGLSPAISIDQRTVGRNPRSTVGTATEIADYLRLLFARAGRAHCYRCGQPIASQSAEEMANRILGLPEGSRVQVLAPVVRGRKGAYRKELEGFRRQGFVRARIDGEIHDLADDLQLARGSRHDIEVVVDRVVVRESARARLRESIETALELADGMVVIDVGEGAGGDKGEWLLSRESACPSCGISFPEITPQMFSFNNPRGACEACSGLGTRQVFDPERIVPEPDLSLAEGAIEPWQTPRASKYYRQLLTALADHVGVDLATPWRSLPKRARDAILYGTGDDEVPFEFERGGKSERVKRRWAGVVDELERRAASRTKGERGGDLARYLSARPCPECDGSRLRIEAHHVKLDGHAMPELSALSLERLDHVLSALSLDDAQLVIAERIVVEIRDRLRFLCNVGLEYLSLDRASGTLSGGEAQRIRLATQIGASLMGVLYILDEPSIGLHPRDNDRLLTSLEQLRDMGNSVLVVEHDEATIRRADHVIDMGPGAGIHGGEIVAQGRLDELASEPRSLTGAYVSGRRSIPFPSTRRTGSGEHLTLTGCSEHNLKNVDLHLPLGCFTVVTGVSGSGKSTLVSDTLQRALAARLHGALDPPGRFRRIAGVEHLDKVINVDQSPIGRTPRSNPATYNGIFDGIRRLFAQVPEARVRGYGPGRFSFNVKGGRCEACRGDGLIRIEMSFLPDLFVTCEVCHGRRYNRETLQITYKGKTIADVLDLSVEEALEFMENVTAVRRPLQTLHDVGLDYLHLGQPATTLSGGEAQRIKLARELSKRGTGRTLYVLDEPTTGLHFADVERLLDLLGRLVDKGNTVIVIEHHLDVVKCADHLIDLGPEGGEHGGRVVAAGTPEEVARVAASHTGRALAPLLEGRA